MDRCKVLITRPISREAIDHVASQFEVEVHPIDEAMPQEALMKAMRNACGVMPSGVRIGADAIAQSPQLRAIANIGVGYDNIDVEACTRRGIIVTNTPDVLTEATADLALGLILAVGRRISEGDRYIRALKWDRWQFDFMLGSELHAKTLGIYGFGRIGQAVARRGRGFSMRILYHSRRRVPASVETELAAEFVDRRTLFRESDFLSVHVPLTPETHYAIRSPELALMKPSAFFINTGRGSIVEESALVDALLARQIAGAGLDVFEHEPKMHPALLGMENVVLLPHIGSSTAETRLRMCMLAGDNLLAALNGRHPPNLVNPEAIEHSLRR